MKDLPRILTWFMLFFSVIQACNGGIPNQFALLDGDRWGFGAHECDMMVDYNCFSEGNARNTEGSFGFKREYVDYRDVRYRSVDFPFEIGRSFKIKDKLYCGPLYKFKFRDVQLSDDTSPAANSVPFGIGTMHLSGFGGRFSYRNLPNGQIYRRQRNILTVTGMVYSNLFFSSTDLKPFLL